MKMILIQNKDLNVKNYDNFNVNNNDSLFIVPTQLGRAVLASSFSPTIAINILNDLENATKSLCLDSELHMLYLVLKYAIFFFK